MNRINNLNIIIVFYNFNSELDVLLQVCKKNGKPVSMVNGSVKDLSNYDNCDNSVTLIQYQSGSMGLNLQKANKIVYYSPCLSSEYYEQSKKRTHRIGQKRTCIYYRLIVSNSVEEKIYDALSMRKDYTDKLFQE